MDKNDFILFWLKGSEKDWEVVHSLFNSGHYMHSLFFAHLTIEKLIKAHWVKDNDADYPPRIHNLDYLLKQTKLDLEKEHVQELVIITSWNIEGRYQDYKDRFHTICTKEYTDLKIETVNKIRLCLIEKLQ